MNSGPSSSIYYKEFRFWLKALDISDLEQLRYHQLDASKFSTDLLAYFRLNSGVEPLYDESYNASMSMLTLSTKYFSFEADPDP